jgi:tetratricopeptide (TPR) repeat protein
MFRVLGTALRARPWTTCLGLVVLIVLGTLGGLYGYACHQWHTACAEVRDGRAAQARDRLPLCLFVWPSSAEVHLLAARAARLTGDYPEAEAHLKQCLRLQGGASEASQLEFLLLRVQTGEEDEVAPALLDLVENEHPESLLILETLARAYMHHLRYGPAYNALTRWIARAPDAAKPYHWRGWVLERMNSHEQAMLDYRKALSLDPDLAQVRLRVAEMLLEDHNPREALGHLEHLHRQVGDRPDVQARLGQCHFQQGRLEEARRILEEVVRHLPTDAAVLVHLGKLEQQQGRPAKAEEWLRRALAADPADTEARFALASCLRLQGRTQEAAAAQREYEKHKALLQRANRLLQDEAKNPGTSPTRPAEVGALLLEVGQEKQGLYWLDQALQRDPGNQPALRALVAHFERRGDSERAAAYRRRLARLAAAPAAPPKPADPR